MVITDGTLDEVNGSGDPAAQLADRTGNGIGLGVLPGIPFTVVVVVEGGAAMGRFW